MEKEEDEEWVEEKEEDSQRNSIKVEEEGGKRGRGRGRKKERVEEKRERERVKREKRIKTKRTYAVSELTRDGQMIIRRFISLNETQQLNEPRYLSLDSDDQVFVAEYSNEGVILLDSDLKWNRILCPTKEETEETKIRYVYSVFYDEEKKQLIVGGDHGGQGVNVYTLSRN